MSDVASRPAASRGRGSARGGRGAFSGRGGGGGRASNRPAATNGDSKHDSDALPTLDDQGEIGDLKKLHGSKVSLIKDVVPEWSDVDILYALKETDGNADLTVERIFDGSISQWGEVSNQKKDRTRAKAKDNTFTTTTGTDGPSATNTRPARGGRIAEGGRGRGRATERGGRVARGRSSVAPVNGSRVKENQPLSVPTEDSSAWDNAQPAAEGGWDTSAASAWDTPAVSDSAPTSVATPPATEAPKSTVIPSGAQAKTWASMLRQSTAPKPAVPQPKPAPAAKAEPPIEPLPAAEPAAELAAPEPEPEPIAELSAEPPQEQPAPAEEEVVVPEVALPPSKDQLTEKNVEQVTDTSNPPETETAASEAADSWDPRAAALSATATPLSASQAQHQMPKAPSSGFAASAIKATNPSASRTPSHQQRRFLDQQEAVRMPGNRDVERAAVQFGAFSLNDPEEDIDGDREEPETRAQPPADSPVTQPRASLPPAPTAAVPEPYAAVQKPVASLPPNMTPTAAPVPPIAPAAQQQPSIPQAAAPQPPTQPASQQYGRFGQPPSQEPSAFSQKTFDSPYGQQANPAAAQSHYDGFPSQQPTQPQSQQPGSAFSSAANDYSSAYYTADGQPGRQNYNYYGQQDSAIGSRSGFGGYATSQTDLASQYPQSTSQSRFAASTAAQDQTSGNTTPNPSAQGQQQTAQGHPQSHGGQPQQHGSQFFGHPSYNYAGQGYQGYNQYMNQYGYTQGGYGGAPYGKGAGQYGQHQYGAAMAQHSPYDQTVSTAAPGYPQSTLHRADSGLGSAGLGDYGRAGSAQSAAQPGLGSGGFGGMHDSYGGRGAVYGSQAGQSFNTPSTQPGGGPSSTDDLKPFGDGKSATGPSPALGGAARPGSATNATPGQSGLPPPQAGQHGMGYGGYPAHLQSHGGLHGNQASAPGYGMGGATGQAHQNNAYAGQYGSGGGFGNNSYYNQQPRHGSGWGTNYSGGSNNHY